MFTQILTTLDGSEYSERALGYARDLASVSGARVALLTVVPTRTSRLDETDADGLEGRKVRAFDYLEEKAQALREAGVAEVTVNVRFGQPSTTIAELAGELHADLIVMSTHGAGADELLGIGSVALKVLMVASCPVLMVRVNTPEPPRNLAEERWQWEGGANVG
ncbi:MAG: universal stress protein [Dehalococcoidia bacterium]